MAFLHNLQQKCELIINYQGYSIVLNIDPRSRLNGIGVIQFADFSASAKT
jgi:hypothetical protein